MARRTTTSTEVKARWIAKNYKRYQISLRYDSDKELIEYLDKRLQSDGVTDIFREALEALIESEK